MDRQGVVCLLVVCSTFGILLTHGAFEGYQIFSVRPVTREHVKSLNGLADDFVDVDFWQDPAPNRTVHLVVPPGLVAMVTERMTKEGIHWEMAQVDLSGMVEASITKNTDVFHHARLGQMDVVDHYNYHTYAKIESYLVELQAKYPDNLELSYMNYYTHEGRQVVVAKVHGTSGTNKPSIIGEAGIHAREWVTPAATIYVIEKLLQNYHLGEVTSRSMLERFDWYFIPVTNPDGYDYTHASPENRLWRKNRRIMSSRCTGIDLNRNFDVEFGTTGVSKRCDSNIYPGTHGFSEPETANVRDLFNQLKSTLVGYLSIHAYSQLVIVPWGYVMGVSRPQNYQELDRVANLMSSAIYASDGKVYNVGTAYQLLDYAASGASEDWALTQKASLYAYCYELRPSYDDPRGFVLPPNEIVPTGRELLDSLAVMAGEMKV